MSLQVGQILVSGNVLNKRFANSVADEVNSKSIILCNDNLFSYVNNVNISNIQLFSDGFYLLEPGISKLTICRIYIYIYKFTSGCHSQTTPSSEWR